MDIEGFGEKLSARFLDEGLIRDQADIYDLTAEKLAALDGFGETSARNLVEAIEASKAQPFGIVLFALGLPEVGFVTAQALAEHFGTIDALIEASEERDPGGRGRRARSSPSGLRRSSRRSRRST